jgi:hypothetical protein
MDRARNDLKVALYRNLPAVEAQLVKQLRNGQGRCQIVFLAVDPDLHAQGWTSKTMALGRHAGNDWKPRYRTVLSLPRDYGYNSAPRC